MDNINTIFFNLGVKFLKRKNDKLDTILEPLQTMIQLSILSVLPVNTKVSIANNNVYLQEPDISQSIIRWYQDDKFHDLFYIFNSCKLFSKFYKQKLSKITNENNNLFQLLISMSLKGIDILIQTYSSKKNNHITELLKLYKFILSDRIEENKFEEKDIDSVFIKITDIYDKDELYCIYYLLYTLNKNKDKNIIKALNILLEKKRKEIQSWIIKKLSV
jgi:hypothetical protein